MSPSGQAVATSAQAVANSVQAVAAVVSSVAEVAGVLPPETFISAENVKELHEELKEQMDSLRAKMKDCDDKALEDEISMKTTYEYNVWTRKVIEIDFHVTEMLSHYASEIQTMGDWTDILRRIHVGTQIKNRVQKIEQLKKELTEMGNILVAKQPDHVVKIHIAPDIAGFETLNQPLKTTLNLLKCGKDVRGIQIHGNLGIGKTSIMQNLNNHKDVAKMFQIVIWLKVSSDMPDANNHKKNFSIQELQRDIMGRLNLDDSIPVYQYTQKIWHKLKDKKYLLLLDNVKEYLNIDEIGFPNNWEKGSKIVLTTRLKHVCPSIVDHSIKIGFLTTKEARKMFSNLLKPKDFRDNPFIMDIMHKVVHWCGGLPSVIKIVAGYFRLRDTETSWRTGLRNLNSWLEYGDDNITQMCRSLSFCCDYLKSAEKDCFYYSALYPEESNICKDRLLDCWTAERLLGSKGNSVRDDGHLILEHLNNLNLLEEDEQRIGVRMHKLIRLVALHNLSIDGKHKCLVIPNEAFADQQNVDSWKGKHWISSADNKSLKTFSDIPDCSLLSTLFLQGNSNLRKFPPLFFEQMRSLRVLDLMGTGIESLPISLMNASNLEVLYLNGCTNLLELPSEIGYLKFLEVLDVSGSGVNNVPPQIHNLKSLKRLFVSIGASSETDTFNVLSNSAELQELVIDTRSEKQTYNWGIIDVVMKLVETLKHMTSLQFRFLNDEVVDVIKVVDGVTRIYAPKEKNLQSFIDRGESLDSSSFKVFIDCPISPDVKIPKSQRFQRYVKYCNGNGKSPTIIKLLSKADSLVIDNHDDLEHLSEFEPSSLQAIKGCLVENCNKVRIVVDHYTTLLNLERLYLNNLPELESLWGGALEFDTLPKLKTLKLSRCPKVIMIITQDAVEGIINFSQNSGEQPRAFPNLKEIILVEMPHLTSIWENNLLEWPALKTLETRKCPGLNNLPFSKDNAIKLTSITTEKVWWEALQWTDNVAKEHFQQYCTFGNIFFNFTSVST